MHPRKQQYADQVYFSMEHICRQFAKSNDMSVEEVLELSPQVLQELIKKVLIAIPDRYFYNANESTLEKIVQLISKDFVLFQIQENVDSENYGHYLINFIDGLIIDIAQQFYPAGSEV